MMTKMGWSEGNGLGADGTGSSSHVKVKKKLNTYGVGMKTSHDDDWIAHQDQFNALLSQLNRGGTSDGKEKKIQCLEERVRLTKTKIMYSKFVKSKDLSRATSNDLASIFGQRSKSAPATPQRSEDEEESLSDGSTASCPTERKRNSNTEHGFTTIHTGVSVSDYFAKKMAAMKEGRKTQSPLTIIEQDRNSDVESIIKKKKHKKGVTFEGDNENVKNQNDEDENEESEITTSSDKKSKKKRKKDKKADQTDDLENGDEIKQLTNDDIVDVKKHKKKKKAERRTAENDEYIVVCEKKEYTRERAEDSSPTTAAEHHESPTTSSPPKKKSKKRKHKNTSTEEISSDAETSPPHKKKSKKRKRDTTATDEPSSDAENVVAGDTTTTSNENLVEQQHHKKSKKKKKRNQHEVVAADDVIDSADECRRRGSKRKKKKKPKSEDDGNESS